MNGLSRPITKRLSERDLEAKKLTRSIEIPLSKEEMEDIQKAADRYTDGDVEQFARFCIVNYFRRFSGR